MSELLDKLDKLQHLHPRQIDLTLDRVWRLLDKLGNPQNRLPPVIHVAGTNGKGSTIAFMRAMLEAAGQRVHAYTSPHLFAFNERIRLAGKLVDDETLLATLNEVETVNGGEPITFFESTTVAALLLFARVPADALLLEVGLGGRLDATNVVVPCVSVITRISYDHMEFLGDTLEQIAGEKAGILKHGVPCIVGYQASEAVRQIFRARAAELGAPLLEYGRDFLTHEMDDGFTYEAKESFKLPRPALFGAHQILNAATAIAALNVFSPLPREAIVKGLHNVKWPGRLDHVTRGSVAQILPPEIELWYDGAHNDSGAEVLAEQCRRWQASGYEIHLVMGMMKTKNPAVFAPVIRHAKTVTTVPLPDAGMGFGAGELLSKLGDLGKVSSHSARSVVDAVHQLLPDMQKTQGKRIILVSGSLYLAQSLG